MHWRAEKLGRDRKKFARGWADDGKPRGSAQHWPGATNQGPKPRKLTSPATLSVGVPRELARAAALAPFVEVLARFAARAAGGGMRAVIPGPALRALRAQCQKGFGQLGQGLACRFSSGFWCFCRPLTPFPPPSRRCRLRTSVFGDQPSAVAPGLARAESGGETRAARAAGAMEAVWAPLLT